MKNTIIILAIIFSVLISSCDSSIGKKKLSLKTIENDDVLVEMFDISEITTVHQFIDITNKRWNKQERILEANQNTVDSIFIKQDTLFLQLTSNDPMIYDLAALKFGYKVVLLEPQYE